MESRRSQIDDKRKTRRAIVLIGTSIALFLFLLFIGFGSIGQVALLANNFKQPTQNADSTDKTPPGPPRIDAQPPFVKDQNYTLTGYAEINSVAHLFLNDKEVGQQTVGDTSTFSFEVSLEKGENILYATATDPSGNTSDRWGQAKITYDPDPPSIDIDSPQDNDQVYDKSITIKGKTETGATMTAGERSAIVADDGSFSVKYTLTEGANIITLTAIDKAGNKTEKTLTLTYTP